MSTSSIIVTIILGIIILDVAIIYLHRQPLWEKLPEPISGLLESIYCAQFLFIVLVFAIGWNGWRIVRKSTLKIIKLLGWDCRRKFSETTSKDFLLEMTKIDVGNRGNTYSWSSGLLRLSSHFLFQLVLQQSDECNEPFGVNEITADLTVIPIDNQKLRDFYQRENPTSTEDLKPHQLIGLNLYASPEKLRQFDFDYSFKVFDQGLEVGPGVISFNRAHQQRLQNFMAELTKSLKISDRQLLLDILGQTYTIERYFSDAEKKNIIAKNHEELPEWKNQPRFERIRHQLIKSLQKQLR